MTLAELEAAARNAHPDDVTPCIELSRARDLLADNGIEVAVALRDVLECVYGEKDGKAIYSRDFGDWPEGIAIVQSARAALAPILHLLPEESA